MRSNSTEKKPFKRKIENTSNKKMAIPFSQKQDISNVFWQN
jgi:hypothetical protein